MMRMLFFLAVLLLVPASLSAAPADLYQQALAMAANGHDREAVAQLQGAVAVLPATDIWQERMRVAAMLIQMRSRQSSRLDDTGEPSLQVALAKGYANAHQPAPSEASWIPGALAAVFPGAGHAWQGRWQDAMVAALMVWPMLILTLWAAFRRMGPVTVFFALITAWFWSGTVFSAVSLAERGDLESYLIWWQGLWQASGLPGRPW